MNVYFSIILTHYMPFNNYFLFAFCQYLTHYIFLIFLINQSNTYKIVYERKDRYEIHS